MVLCVCSLLFVNVLSFIGSDNVSLGCALNACQIFLPIKTLAFILQILYEENQGNKFSRDFEKKNYYNTISALTLGSL